MLSFSAALMVPSRNPASFAPRSTARTCAFQSIWLVHTSFSETSIKEMVIEAELEVIIVEPLDAIYVKGLTLIPYRGTGNKSVCMAAHGPRRPLYLYIQGLQGSTTPSRTRHGDRTGHVTICLCITQGLNYPLSLIRCT
jgi:hypothetical protein